MGEFADVSSFGTDWVLSGGCSLKFWNVMVHLAEDWNRVMACAGMGLE